MKLMRYNLLKNIFLHGKMEIKITESAPIQYNTFHLQLFYFFLQKFDVC